MSSDGKPKTIREKMAAWREANPDAPKKPLLSNAEILDRMRSRCEFAQEAVDNMICDPTHPRHFAACELVFAYTLGKPKQSGDEGDGNKLVIEVIGGLPREG